MEKNALRRIIRELKKGYSSEAFRQMSPIVWEQLEAENSFREARVVALYWSLEDEVYTHDFIKKWGKKKRILLPCIVGSEIDFRDFDGGENLCTGADFCIPEPQGSDFVSPDEMDIIIVPGVAFDQYGNRLGRGKGFYDKYLQRCPALKIGVCFPFQFREEEIPTAEYDVKMDRVIK